MMQSPTPIGTSMVHLLGATPTTNGNASEASLRPATTPQHDNVLPEDPQKPCLLIPSAHPAQRILLEGPSKSGRTSMAMDLAYSLASTTRSSCSCFHSTTCRCTCVVIYKKAKEIDPSPTSETNHLNATTTNHRTDPEDFPLKCHQDLSLELDGPGNSSHKMPSSWEPAILKGIRIRYVQSLADLLQDLLSIAGRPSSQHPTRAIILDDLDVICETTDAHRTRYHDRRENHNTAMSILQALAVAMDTAHCLERRNGRLPIVLAVCSSDARGIVAPWMDTFVSLHPSGGNSDSADLFACDWRAEFSSSVGATEASYCTVQYRGRMESETQEDGAAHIEWKALSGEK